MIILFKDAVVNLNIRDTFSFGIYRVSSNSGEASFYINGNDIFDIKYEFMSYAVSRKIVYEIFEDVKTGLLRGEIIYDVEKELNDKVNKYGEIYRREVKRKRAAKNGLSFPECDNLDGALSIKE